VSQARSLFVSGERFKAEKAMKINLVHEICKAEELEKKGEEVLKRMLEGGPNAIEAAKFLIHTLSRDLLKEDFSNSLEFAAGELAQLRVLPEAQEGVRAFLEKRPPNWKA
jgi:methylglutaconyl-CoA hydratase